ncbi:TRAP transporter substrate-binding protein [Ancylobacter defluvii]|uniref:ABC transporter substrate-binding protein n=1 Tax=Ancylobacter defluvii TaxID=1282440 RepID=A0A9W6NC35_9HYPH|nr:TRAP transporter substrate-binding protein [Ancylobacter defluvii]MBS7586848.1 TRAP transporter substrate-binding protein [Ancylobacter defluvii]GLK86154.1 ABC transporter substrate-binding protein [Ancylobacter defluvii]
MPTKLIVAVFATLMITPASAETITLRVLGQPSGSGLIAQQKERPFFEKLAEKTGLDVKVEYLPVDVAGIPDTDGLRILKSGLFDIVSIRGPQVSRDEPSVLGLDLVGLNTSYVAGKQHIAAFQPFVDSRLQTQFNAKLLGVWPAGPQVIFCKPEVTGLADLKGLKVRVGDQSAANFVAKLGATGISMPFGEVQQSLARGVVDCAITGPASANSGGWPEATTTVLPIALQLAVNGYAVNQNSLKKFTPDQQAKLTAAIAELTTDIWAFSEELYEDAMRCNTGATPCNRGVSYKLKEAPASEADLKAVAGAVSDVSLPIWAKQCNAVAPACEQSWRTTVGAQLGL